MVNRIPFAKIAEITPGYAFKSKDLGSSGYCVVKIAEISPPRIVLANCERIEPEKTQGLDRFCLNNGDILMAMTGATTGKVGRLWCSEPVYLNQRVAKLTARAGREYDDFIWAVVSQPGFDQKVLANAHGSAQPNVSPDGIGTIEIAELLPEQQLGVGGIIRAVDDKIEQNRRTARALERLARAIFRAWFVDFEPVKAKAAGATLFPSMPQPIFDALPTRFVDSEIGPVPEGWGVGLLQDFCSINARTVRKDEIHGDIEYVDIASVKVGHLDAIQCMSFASAPSRARRRVQHGDTIWSCVRPNHRSYLFIHTPPNNRVVSTGFAVLSPKACGPSYLHQLVIQQEFVDYLVANADGSAYPAVRPEHFAVAQVVIPPQDVLEAFELISMPGRDLIAWSNHESNKLLEMRDYLLPKLLSGKVQVKVGIPHTEAST